MKTEHIIIVVAVIAISGAVLLFIKKKQSKAKSVTISIDTKPTMNRTVPTIDIDPHPSASKEFESFKEQTVESISDRHAEAAKIIKESVENITANKPDDTSRKTKNDAKLEKMREDLENL